MSAYSQPDPADDSLNAPAAVAVSKRCARGEIDAEMHDITQTGIRIETAEALPIGTPLCIEIDFIGAKRAIVAWRREALYGCEFETPLRHVDAARAMSSRPSVRLIPDKGPSALPMLMGFVALATTALTSWWMMPIA